ncbi:MAG: imidazoleglycerol-phosphate dehydratase HisB [Lachnospiraceae bacterium]|nr:imidazoleglycerol-phosphate dehydratase HisB [Lachnospiraceae bacterium]
MARSSEITRKTKETDITLSLALDGEGNGTVSTGIGFFDHMLEGFAKHGLFDLQIKVKGDLQVDAHHTVEDTGIVLGNAIREAFGDKKGIKRYGSCILPMDDALCLCALDLCGRPYLSYECTFTTDRIGEMDTELFREFFYAVSYSAGMNLHLKMLSGINNHHMAEAMFKAFAKALDEALCFDGRIKDVLSTKGSL